MFRSEQFHLGEGVTGVTVLVVEDDPLMSKTILDALEEAGHTVVGTVGTVHEALDIARDHKFQVAVLDYDLHGEPVIPLAWSLTRREIPIIIFTGVDTTVIENTLPHTCIAVPKSRGIAALVRAIDRLPLNRS